MTQQFTASEVRRTAAAIEGKQMLVSSMLRAFADLLEAREKAVPVGCLTVQRFRGSDAMVNHDFDYYGSLPDGSYSLYTQSQSAPSDTERLAEALRTIQHSMQQAQIYGNDSRREIKLSASVCEQALAAHSSQAQPPAASVTDAMVNRLACWMIAQFGECRAPVDHKARIEWWGNQARSALAAALAAQENPNG